MEKHLNKKMIDFVKDKVAKLVFDKDYCDADFVENVADYANTLSEIPRLGHFIPCDKNDIPLVKPSIYDPRSGTGNTNQEEFDKAEQEYKKACERVLFDGFFISENQDATPTDIKSITNGFVHVFWYNGSKGWYPSLNIRTCEDLIRYNPPLTDNGAKFFGYEKTN